MLFRSYHARLASLFSKRSGKICDDELAAASVVHKRAGRLKHNTSKRKLKEVAERQADDVDELFIADPWAGMSAAFVGCVAECRPRSAAW